MRVLLVEPPYNVKYPPLGLMKIATAHSLSGDEVHFHRGNSVPLRAQRWDVVYIATLFTFDWHRAVETIRFYSQSGGQLVVGGNLASLMPDELQMATGIKPHIGPLKGDTVQLQRAVSRAKDEDLAQLCSALSEHGIDCLVPDYGIFDGIAVPYRELLDDYYILRSSRGCSRGCSFCSVKRLDPSFVERIPLKPSISFIKKRWGEKRNLLLLDDNVLMSPRFHSIIDEIRDSGFEKGAKLNGKRRWVDFNQGFDLRLLSRDQLSALSTIAIRPLRLAFDHMSLKGVYVRCIERALEAGFTEISTYILYNFEDSPEDLYNRLAIACELNERYRCRIYSFPMKYIPCDSKDRRSIGPRWTRRQVRGVQCILNATHGIVATKPDFFRVAFGESVREFLEIIQMPENYIVQRSVHARNGDISRWKKCCKSMSPEELMMAKRLIAGGKGTAVMDSGGSKVSAFLSHYGNEYIPSKSV